MPDGFRIQSISIEGFKGFTTQKSIDLKGRHVFLLGQNGNGKSSIIEAIRWNLFGSAGRPNEIVANRNYTGQCCVTTALLRGGKQWNLRRILLKGVSGGSDARLHDNHGQERNIRDIMPQLDSTNVGEGAYIIFASQSIQLRRQPQDLSPFERTVFNHLGLTQPKSLQQQVDTFLSGHGLTEQIWGEKLTDVRTDIDAQIASIERERGIISNSPPWGTGLIPSVGDSENKARDLIAEITGASPDPSLAGVSLDGLIDYANSALANKSETSELPTRLGKIVALRNELEKSIEIQRQIEQQRKNIQDVRSQFETESSGESLDELRDRIAQLKAAKDIATRKSWVAKEVTTLLQSNEADPVLCPVCSAEHNREAIENMLQRIVADANSDTDSDLSNLEKRLASLEDLERKFQDFRKDLAKLLQEQSTIQARISAIDSVELIGRTVENIEESINFLKGLESSFKAQIENDANWSTSMQVRLSDLHRESNFHSLQRKLQQLQESRNRFDAADRSYKNLVDFGQSVRVIHEAIEACLTEKLIEGIPGVSQNLSQVFAALTRHPWYDRLEIATDKLPKLELQVASSQDPSGERHPTDVLNGQAESALELVPYFAFSQTDDAQTEIYLVLLDDPTRAFDEEHIDILVERLAELGSHVQLIVASQETDRFRKLLPQHFERDSYVIIEPTRWSYYDGPELVVEYE